MKIWCLMPAGDPRERFFPPALQQRLEAVGDVTWNPVTTQYTTTQVAERVNDYDVVISGWGSPQLPGHILTPATKFKALIHTAGTIVPFVDAELFARGVQVASANDLFARSVAEGVIAYIMAAQREIPHFDQLVHAGQWRSGTIINNSLYHKSIGLVGFGAITRHLIPLLRPFTKDIRVFSHHPNAEAFATLGVQAASLDEIFSECDIVSLHAALNPDTTGMIDAHLLDQLRPGSLFVNTARAGLVDTNALITRLQRGDIHAALDVFDHEPLPHDHPYRTLENVLLMPHMAGPTSDWYPYIGAFTIKQVQRIADKQPLIDGYQASDLKRMTRPM